jgi:hypothetical protein
MAATHPARIAALAAAILAVAAPAVQAKELPAAPAPQRVLGVAVIHHPPQQTLPVTPTPLRHIGRISGTETLRFYPPATAQQPAAVSDTGFQWGDAGIGAAAAAGLLGLGLLAGRGIRQRRPVQA